MKQEDMRLFSFENDRIADFNKSENPVSLILVDVLPSLRKAMDDLMVAFLNGNSETAFQKYKGTTLDIFKEVTDEEFGIVNDLLVEIEWLIEDGVQDSEDYIHDQFYAYSSLLSSYFVYTQLDGRNWLDARDYIHTDDSYKKAKRIQLKPLPDSENLYISQARIGSTLENTSTTNLTVENLWI